jgi:UDP-N-acetylglucosamine--N-acetylmuramyl-(pentapeptide) pyrophosphoryl-undecaprenol N-acetylglucosamine transferase
MAAVTAARSVMLAAGGTGGHLFPAFALAQELGRRSLAVDLVTDMRGDRYGADFPARAVYRVPSATFTGRSPIAAAETAWMLMRGIAAAYRLLGQVRPGAVVGFGGYPAFPPLFAATLRKIPTALHEQNAVLGRANRLVAPLARRIATCFPEVEGVAPSDRAKLTSTGNPVRPEITALAERPYPAFGPEGRLTFLITGGSQGASLFSQVIPAAIGLLPEGMRRRLHLVQQVRADDLDAVRKVYATLGVEAELSPFFADLPSRLAGAHLVLGRAGASTIAETAVAGRPAILVPLAIATDDHQTKNARALEGAGAAIVMPEAAFTAEALAARLQPLLALPDKLRAMAAAARTVGVVDAAERLADLVLATAPANRNDSASRPGRSAA